MRLPALAYTGFMTETDRLKGGMLPFKIAAVIVYVVFIYQVLMRPLTLGANMSIGLSITIALLHVYQCFRYWDVIQRAPGSVRNNTMGILVFGVFHMVDLKEAIRDARRTTGPQSRLFGANT